MIGDVPARRDAGGRQLQRGVDADAVDHERGAAAARGAADVLRRQPVRLQGDVGAGGDGHLESLLAAVDRDDAAAAQRAQQLDRDVAEAADADDHGGRARAADRGALA